MIEKEPVQGDYRQPIFRPDGSEIVPSDHAQPPGGEKDPHAEVRAKRVTSSGTSGQSPVDVPFGAHIVDYSLAGLN
jgi:hypothetical protein